MKIANISFDKGSYEIVWMNNHIHRISGWGYDENKICWVCVLRTEDGNILVLKDYDNTRYQIGLLEYGEPTVWWDLDMFDMYMLGEHGKTSALPRRIELYMAEFQEETRTIYYFPNAEEVLEKAREVIF